MYAKYTYAAGSTAANVLADIVKIVTGETNKANLSANCDQANTDILTTYNVAGWSVHDAAGGTNRQVLSAPNSDTGTKYAVLDTNTSGFFIMHTAESWNAGTHVGTNVTNIGTGNQQRVNLTSGGVLYVYATARCIFLNSFQSGVWGMSTGNGGWSGIVERKRGVLVWDTLAAAYPLGCYITSYGGISSITSNVCQSPRIRIMTGVSDGTLQYFLLDTFNKGPSVSWSSKYFPATKLLDASNNPSYTIAPILIAGYNPFFMSGDLSQVTDAYLLQPGQGGNLDELTYNSKTYVVWNNLGGATPATTAGSLIVPKG